MVKKSLFAAVFFASLLYGPMDCMGKETQLRYPSYLSKYDFATRGDTRYLRLLDRFTGVEERLEKWLLFKQIKKMNNRIAEYLDARTISVAISESFAIEGQPATKDIENIVQECSAILQVEKPKVRICQNPQVDCYVSKLAEPHFLIITSGLLELYENKPNELRFIIGHELGHLKCDHLKVLFLGNSVLTVLARIDTKALPKESQGVLPPLGLGFLLAWSRQAEFSADRAGLLCCQDLEVAEQALLRLMHGLKHESPWLNKEHKDIDADKVIEDFEYWENQPLVRFINKLRTYGSTHPFIPDRIIALRAWHENGKPGELLSRVDEKETGHILRLKKISLSGLHEGDPKINSFCKIMYGDRTVSKIDTIKDNANPIWDNLNRVIDWKNGCPIIIEIYKDKWMGLREEIIGEAVVFIEPGQTEYIVSIQKDITERKDTVQTAVAEISVSFLQVNQQI